MEKYIKICCMFMILISTLSCVAMESPECKAKRELDMQCSKYCYTVLKPLLQHASSMLVKEKSLAEKQLKVDEYIQTIADQQKTIELKDKELDAKIQLIETKDKQLALQLQLIEAKDKQLALKLELLKSKDKQVNVNLESTDKQLALQLQLTEAKDKQLASQLQLIEVRDKELALQNELINSYKAKKNEMENEKDKEILRLKSLIKEKDLRISDLELKSTADGAKINDLETKQTEYMKILEGSNCLGKSIASIIKLPHIEPFLVPCDFKIAGSGWIVIQRRMDGTEDFNRNWEEYKAGFGDLQHEYFIGLEKIHLLTQSQPHELYIQLEDFNNEIRYARYSDFLIGSEEESYNIIKVGDYSGNAGDPLQFHLNMKFSTKDRDNDTAKAVNPANASRNSAKPPKSTPNAALRPSLTAFCVLRPLKRSTDWHRIRTEMLGRQVVGHGIGAKLISIKCSGGT
ncbi:angiopoietin-2-like [Drosophila hydei]|uniref:Angiopoietin-2-like n=1 Tax=Drosophila hydei TaxID=7224 RepID=A0A6J2SXX4_DROHY|nr:angiopoietin-2-like [Drosophila hydei]